MSKHHLRKDPICQNCGSYVEQRFCSKCGQENTDVRQSFRQLTAHFIEDLTHYEGKFWITLKYLFLRPAFLTKELLAGKKISFLPPVRLYIFASFITFLLPHLLPEAPYEHEVHLGAPVIDTNYISKNRTFEYSTDSGLILRSPVQTLHKLDSMRAARAGSSDPLEFSDYWMYKRAIVLQHYNSLEVLEIFSESVSRSFPKALFLYMPLFALVIRLFHSKRNWMYFDHAIFTLHYFSFMLLSFGVILIISFLFDWLNYFLGYAFENIIGLAFGVIFLAMITWYILYFFRAHRVLYGESWLVSTSKALGIYVINLCLFVVMMITIMVVALTMLH